MSLVGPSRVLFPMLLELTVRGAGSGPVDISTSELGMAVGISQQAASLHLSMLEKMEFIQRKSMGRKSSISLTERGLAYMVDIAGRLSDSLDLGPLFLVLSGVIVLGMGEGAYYMSLEGYRRQFKEVLGITPYPGTLNVKLSSHQDIARKKLLNYREGLRIKEWKDARRTYGGLTCYPATLNSKVDVYACVIDRTSHDDSIIEFIAEKNIKKALHLKEGDPVTIAIRV